MLFIRLRSHYSPSLSHFFQYLAVVICLGLLSEAVAFLRKLAILRWRFPISRWRFHVKPTRPSRGVFPMHVRHDVGTKMKVYRPKLKMISLDRHLMALGLAQFGMRIWLSRGWGSGVGTFFALHVPLEAASVGGLFCAVRPRPVAWTPRKSSAEEHQQQREAEIVFCPVHSKRPRDPLLKFELAYHVTFGSMNA
jgi:hypothetical protein